MKHTLPSLCPGSVKLSVKPRQWTALYLICLIALTSCSPAPVKTEIVRVTPPMVLLMETKAPTIQGRTYGDAIIFGLEAHGALLECNGDKDSLREWAAQ